MSWAHRSFSFLRRLYVFYLFLLVVILFFGFYYYKFLPDNQAELNARGLRILKQISNNAINKNNDLLSLVQENDEWVEMEKKNGAYRLLDKLIPYNIDKTADSVAYHIGYHDYDWYLIYPLEACPDSSFNVSIDVFMNPVLANRNDLFESFMVLLDTAASGFMPAGEKNLAIIYDRDNLTSGKKLNTDSLFHLAKNSDLSAVAPVSISGKKYEAFFRPFELNNQHLIFAGFVSQDAYSRQVKNIPSGFLSAIIVIILLILILLPFIKVFFLSAGESIGSKDVLANALSIFLGAAGIFLCCFYFFINLVASQVNAQRLRDLSMQIKHGFETEVKKANEQLVQYSALYRDNILHNPNFARALVNRKTGIGYADSVNRLFTPNIFRQVIRVFWIDSSGNTLAKWNPFDFYAALTGVGDYSYFQIFKQKKPFSDSSVNASFYVLNSGKSNATGEFQVFIIKPCNDTIIAEGMQRKKAYAIVIACFMNAATFPVLPAGYGFCIIDKNGSIVIDSQNNRDLAEDFLEETGNNEQLTQAILNKNSDPVDNVDISGTAHLVMVSTLTTQPLSLVLYYDKSLLGGEVFRLFHFTVESMLYIFLSILLCALLSTGIAYGPGKLKFNIGKIEWIRPLKRYQISYQFTSCYFIYLLVLWFLFCIRIIRFDLDDRNLFYISLLLPLYCFFGFMVTRKKVNAPETGKKNGMIPEIVRTGRVTLLCIIFFNLIIYRLTECNGAHHYLDDYKPLLLFQAAALLLLLALYARLVYRLRDKPADTSIPIVSTWVSNKWKLMRLMVKLRKRMSSGQPVRAFTRSYTHSLFLAMLLISVLPAIGIMTYGFYAQKIQHKKINQLAIAANYENRISYFRNELTPMYKRIVKEKLDSMQAFGNIECAGIYLTDDDSVGYTGDPVRDTSAELIDEPYASLMNNFFVLNSGNFSDYAIKKSADDSSWFFSADRGERNRLRLSFQYKTNTIDPSIRNVTVASALQNPWQDFWRLPAGTVVIFSIISIGLCLFSYRLIKSLVRRLFLLDYFGDNPNPQVDKNYLQEFFSTRPSESFAYPHIHIHFPLSLHFFKKENEPRPHNIFSEEDYILAMSDYFRNNYQRLWDDLSEEEQYFLFDLSNDGYTNYKNASIIFKLYKKGIILYDGSRLSLFAQSFRNFILTKKGSAEIAGLKDEHAAPGVWESIRLPILTILGGTAIFLVVTQDDFINRISGGLASLLALVPLVIKLFQKPLADKPGEGG